MKVTAWCNFKWQKSYSMSKTHSLSLFSLCIAPPHPHTPHPIVSLGLESNALKEWKFIITRTPSVFLCHVYLTCYQNLASSQSISLSPLLHHRHSWQLNTSSKSATTHICTIVKLVHSRLSKQVRLRASKIKLVILPDSSAATIERHKYIQYNVSFFMDLLPGPR